MHDIEPHFLWRDEYIAAEDQRSPFYGREYDEFQFTHQIYNYFIHPQWDHFGSPTLYLKITFVDYDEGGAILELIGEWNDCLGNDIMFLKREVIEPMLEEGIRKFILICENVLNFHGSDDCYYEEWREEVSDDNGWICLLNTLDHVEEEMEATQLQHWLHFGGPLQHLAWRPHKPKILFTLVENILLTQPKQLFY